MGLREEDELISLNSIYICPYTHLEAMILHHERYIRQLALRAQLVKIKQQVALRSGNS